MGFRNIRDWFRLLCKADLCRRDNIGEIGKRRIVVGDDVLRMQDGRVARCVRVSGKGYGKAPLKSRTYGRIDTIFRLHATDDQGIDSGGTKFRFKRGI